jgi:hypothetical protein
VELGISSLVEIGFPSGLSSERWNFRVKVVSALSTSAPKQAKSDPFRSVDCGRGCTVQ